MTPEEIEFRSTKEERWAEQQYKRLQREARETGTMGETALLEASQCISILVQRNQRLGLT